MRKIAVLLLALSLTACASQSFDQQVSAYHFDQEDINKGLILVRVSSSGSPISDGMVLGGLKTGAFGNSNSVQGIVEALSIPNATIAVAGAGDALNNAYLEAAMKKYQGQSSATVYVKATPAKIEALKKIAQPKGITVKGRTQ